MQALSYFYRTEVAVGKYRGFVTIFLYLVKYYKM